MQVFFTSIFTAIAIALLVPSALIFLEVCLARRFKSSRIYNEYLDPIRVVILIPAHNEGISMLPTLEHAKLDLGANDRLIVVADNCTDDTEAIALRCGAEVIRRDEPERRGKGFALAFGLEHLTTNPPDSVVVMDADCRFRPGTISKLAQKCASVNRPVQALYLMKSPKGNEKRFAVAEFAWTIKNLIRPLGLSRLGLPCQLNGTGMAFPWRVIRSVEVATDSVVEDQKLGIELSRKGYPPLFYPDVVVCSEFPASTKGELTQRQRWEQGSLTTIIQEVLPSLFAALYCLDTRLFVQSLDIMVPPLVVHALTLLSLFLITLGSAVVFDVSYLPAWLVAISSGMLIGSIAVSWANFGREILPMKWWPTLLRHLFHKRDVYRGFLGGGPKIWVKTTRQPLTGECKPANRDRTDD